jgi:predicted chitinase
MSTCFTGCGRTIGGGTPITRGNSIYNISLEIKSWNLKNYKIDTPNRICSFLAVITTETGNLQNVTELASGQQYEGRNDLGNTQPGDGVKYNAAKLIVNRK